MFSLFFCVQNHLDLHAVLWLEAYLTKWPKTFIVVSHAREFLNTVTLSCSIILFDWSIILQYLVNSFAISHACFVLQVVTDILYLQNQKLTTYKGDYDTFERTRAELLKNKQKAFESNERSREHMQV